MPKKNSNQRKRKSKSLDGFRISNRPVVHPDNEQERDVTKFDYDVGLPRVDGAPMLFAIARDPHSIFSYWSIDWPTMFAKTVPIDRQAHVRVYRAKDVEEESMAVEPMTGNCYITVSRPGESYHVEIGYYQPADVWNSIAACDVTTPRDKFGDCGDVDLATIPFHLSFQRLIDLFGVSKGDAVAEMISQFQKRALSNENSKQLSAEEREILRTMGLSLSEIAAARRAFIDTTAIETLRKRTETLFGFGPTSPSRVFSQSSWALAGS